MGDSIGDREKETPNPYLVTRNREGGFAAPPAGVAGLALRAFVPSCLRDCDVIVTVTN
jgi:hypothetical protein